MLFFRLSGRSQPPLFTQMVADYYEETNDRDFLREVVPQLHRELKFWQERAYRSIFIDGVLMYQYKVSFFRFCSCNYELINEKFCFSQLFKCILVQSNVPELQQQKNYTYLVRIPPVLYNVIVFIVQKFSAITRFEQHIR
jgi:hypothetical protein